MLCNDDRLTRNTNSDVIAETATGNLPRTVRLQYGVELERKPKTLFALYLRAPLPSKVLRLFGHIAFISLNNYNYSAYVNFNGNSDRVIHRKPHNDIFARAFAIFTISDGYIGTIYVIKKTRHLKINSSRRIPRT